jgi:hypothetical protein
MAFNTDGGSFRIAAKTNAVNYVGSSTASIRFKYYLQTTLSTLIPNDSVLPIVVDYDL